MSVKEPPHLVAEDSSEENRRLLRTHVEKNGRPLAVYSDRASLFVNTPKNSAGEDPKPGFPFWPWHGESIPPRCPEYHVFSR